MARRKQLGIPGPSYALPSAEQYGAWLDDYATLGDWERVFEQAKAIRQDEPDLASIALAFENRGRAIEARLDGKIALASELEAESERNLAAYARERSALDAARHRKTLGNPEEEIELSDNEQELLVYLDDLERRGVFSDQVIRKAMLLGEPYFYYGVTYSQITPESAEHGDFSDTGWTVEKTEGTLDDVLSDARRYGIQPRGLNDATDWWESDYSTDYRTGEEEMHSLHVDINVTENEVQDLSSYVFDFIDMKLGGKPSAALQRVSNPGSAAAKRMMNPRNY